jgi:hypothetical protein
MHRILIIGTGSIGERHRRCLLATGRVTAGIVEVNPKLRQDIAQRYKVPEVFDSLDAALRKLSTVIGGNNMLLYPAAFTKTHVWFWNRETAVSGRRILRLPTLLARL